MYLNAKMIPAETVPGIRGGGIKESSGGSKFKYDVINTL
jgi:transglutaminase-like putative cysteine protease